MTQPAPYESLTPDTILDALESTGLEPSGSLLALNSYENRVYQAGLEDQSFIVVKFYRPERWSDAAIAEEHQFTQTLFDEELSVVTPMALTTTDAGQQTVFQHGSFRFAVFARQGGHPPNLENLDDLEVLSRTIARMHAVGARQPFEHRPQINVQRFGHDSRNFLLENNFLPSEMEAAYATVSEHLLQRIEPLMINVPNVRIHGDCHMGNILWRNDVPHFVDFDDCMMGPPIQDLWMLLSGERYDQTGQLATVLDAYNDFFSFDVATLGLIEPLRTLRIMHHAAWIARRWHDPAFPPACPTFDSVNYWSKHVLELREQLALLDEPPLTYM
ncbi:MAG: serine/threonine protein kinase [Proteobacteria bacterium]|nr:serine/threonine protein kinase [Pseudomonadota bacterium]